jgi:acyl carrier protein
MTVIPRHKCPLRKNLTMNDIDENLAETARLLTQFVLKTFLPGEDPSSLRADYPLLSTGVIDSIAALQLVSFIEEQFAVRIEPQEAVPANLDTIRSMCEMIARKRRT